MYKYFDSNYREQISYKPFGEVKDRLYCTGSTGADARLKYIGKQLDFETNLADHGVRKYDNTLGQFTSIDPLWEKYYGWTPYQYCGNNPLSFLDRGGNEVFGFIINLETAEAYVFSDVKGVYVVPVGVLASGLKDPHVGEVNYANIVKWGPVNSKWEDADVPWQKNEDNPFGPVIIMTKNKDGSNPHTHLHGTNGPMDGGIDYIGGNDPNERKFSHGCTRFTNKDIVSIVKEGVRKNAPILYVNNDYFNRTLGNIVRALVYLTVGISLPSK